MSRRPRGSIGRAATSYPAGAQINLAAGIVKGQPPNARTRAYWRAPNEDDRRGLPAGSAVRHCGLVWTFTRVDTPGRWVLARAGRERVVSATFCQVLSSPSGLPMSPEHAPQEEPWTTVD